MDAFRSYDFDGDEQWNAYALNLTIPPGKEHMLDKFKAKWYQRNIDPAFDVSLVSPASTATTSSKTVPPKDVPLPHSTSAKSTEGRSTQQSSSTQRITLPDMALFIGHLLLIASAIASLNPLNRYLAYRAYFICCRVSFIVHCARVLRKYGTPSFSNLKGYLQEAGTSTEFFYGIASLMASSNPHLWLITLPMAILATYHASAYLRKIAGHTAVWQKYIQGTHTYLTQHQSDSLQTMAIIEILTLFSAGLGVFRLGIRGMMVTYMMANQLRIRYWNPESRPYHVAAWHEINIKIQPVTRALPMLNGVLAMGQRWFQQPMQQAQHRE